MITVSQAKIEPIGIESLPLGRSEDVKVSRDHDNRLAPDAFLFEMQKEFLRIVDTMAPVKFHHGVTFMRVLESQKTILNETHRDKGDWNVLNFTCLVSRGDSLQLEFFADDDFFEQNPQIIPNGHVIMCSKELHRRPGRNPQPGSKVFLSANLYR